MKQRICVVGVAGPSGSGKSTLCRAIVDRVGASRTAVISADAYYRDLSHLEAAARARVDFDDPAALDLDLLASHLGELRCGRAVEVPTYDFATHTRGRAGEPLAPRPLILVEGLFCLAHPGLAMALDVKVFVDAPEAICLDRRVERDVRQRGRTERDVREQYAAQVAPAMHRIVLPSRTLAHLVVPGTAPVRANADLVCANLRYRVGFELRSQPGVAV